MYNDSPTARKRRSDGIKAAHVRKKTAAHYPAILRKDTLDQEHRGIVDYVGRHWRDHRAGPTMKQVARDLHHSAEWVRQACGRLEKAGILVKTHVGSACPLRLADSDEYAAGITARWLGWLAELPESERAHLFLAVQSFTRGAIAPPDALEGGPDLEALDGDHLEDSAKGTQPVGAAEASRALAEARAS